MADIEIAIIAKNQASAAINQTSADLAGLATAATATNATLSGLSNISQGLTGAGATIQAVTANLSELSAAARESGQSIASSIRGPDTTGITNITTAIGTLRGELATLKQDASSVLAKGVLGDGTAASAGVARIANQISLLGGDLSTLRAASIAASNAGILGDASGPKAAIDGVAATITKLRDELSTVVSSTTGVSVNVSANDTAIPVLKQVQAELAATTQQSAATNTALSTVGGTMAGISTATTSLQTLAAEMRDVAAQAQTTNKVLSEPVRIQNAAGAQAISLGIKAARDEVKGLISDLDGISKAGQFDFGQGSTAGLVAMRAELAKQLVALDDIDKAAKTAASAGLLGDGSGAAQNLAQVTQATQTLRTGLQGVAQQAKATASSVKNDLSGVNTAVSSLGQIFSGGGLGVIAGGLGLAAAAVGIQQIGGAINDAVAAGDRLGKLRGAFDQLAAAAGQSSEQMLSSLRAASNGMVSDADLILSANKAMLLGVADTGEELASLLEVARARGSAMGLDVNRAFNDIVTGIGRLSPRILDNLGIIVDEEAAYARLAETLRKNADQLTENEKRQALLNEITREGQTLTIKPPTGASAAIGQAQAASANAQAEAGQFFAPAVRDAYQAYSDGLDLVQGKLDLVKRSQRELNDIIADGKGVTANGVTVTLDDEQVSRFQNLSVAIQAADTAIAAGVPHAQEYKDALIAQADAAIANVNVTDQMASAAQLAVSTLTAEVSAQKEKAAAHREAADAAREGIPFFKSLAEAQKESAIDAFQASEEMRKLASGLGFAGKVAVAMAGDIDEANAALRRLNSQNAIKSTFDGARQSALSKARSVVQQGIDEGRIKATDGAQEFNKLAIGINSINDPLNTDIVTMFRFEQQLDAGTDATERANDAFREQNEAAKKLAEDGLQALKQQYDDIKGKVAGVISDAQKLPSFKAHQLFNAEELKTRGLTGDASVTVDQAVEGGSSRSDAINENARRLMAIAAEGFKDQPWLEEFKREVPEVFKELSESPDIRGAAFNILQRFEQGLEPELLDKGLIKDRVKAMILGEENAAALAEEIAQEIAGELGISLQQAMAATNTTLGIGKGEGDAGAAVQAPDLTEAGTTTGESFSAGIIAGFNVSGMTGQIVAKIDAEFSNPKNIDALKKSGGTVGAVWGTGFLNTVGTNIPPGLYDVLVSGLVPLIVASLAGQGSRTGAQP